MIYCLIGKIIALMDDSAAIICNGVGYEVLLSHPGRLTLNEESTLYTYEVFGQDEHYLVGFQSLKEKEAFSSLIQVKGIGPKTALGALRAATPEELYVAIEANNTSYLKKLPGIGPKAAAQIILDLKGKLVKTDEKGNPKQYEEVTMALKQLGFKAKEIDDALSSINEPDLDNQKLLKLALHKLRK